MNDDWAPVLVGIAGLLTGLGLAYMVTRPKTIEERAREILAEKAVRNHVKRLERER